MVLITLLCLLGVNVCFAAPNTWTRKADFGGTARYGAVAFSIGDKGYVGTGRDDTSWYKDFWEYDPGSLVLCTGWNFISLPLTPTDTTINQVLAPVSSKVAVVWGYDTEVKSRCPFSPSLSSPGRRLFG